MTALLKTTALDVHYPVPHSLGEILTRKPAHFVKAVNQVDFSINEGDTIGIVGESGCGKSTLGRSLLGLEKTTTGSIQFLDKEISELDKEGMKLFRQSAQMIFQDPYASLNPKMTIRKTLTEVLKVHSICSTEHYGDRIEQLLDRVGLSSKIADRLPRTLSGGQCQRIGIARALAVEPKLIIADEAVSALDVSVQAQILNLFLELKQQRNLTLLFISHDLEVVRHVCQRVAVMYLGRIVEMGSVSEVFNNPRHPYTKALLSSRPNVDGPRLMDTKILPGEPPSPMNLPSGCAFHPRCSDALPECALNPKPEVTLHAGTRVACHLD